MPLALTVEDRVPVCVPEELLDPVSVLETVGEPDWVLETVAVPIPERLVLPEGKALPLTVVDAVLEMEKEAGGVALGLIVIEDVDSTVMVAEEVRAGVLKGV